ncbi:MAG: YD repeat-containing protein, partial [Acidimicrobiaceae bacterium]
ALGNSANSGFHLAELEVPQLRLQDTAVFFDAAGRLAAAADLSGNAVGMTRDAGGRITAIADATRAGSSEATRGLELTWSGTQLASLGWRGVSSTGTPVHEPGIVAYEEVTTTAPVRSEYRILRTSDGTETAVLTYVYDLSKKIIGAHDASGVGFEVAYENGRVRSVTRSGDPTPTVTTYTYGADTVSIETAAGGVSAPTRVIELSPALGYQATKATVLDPTGDDVVTSVAYDEYGQPWKTTDPLGRITRTERDGGGNVLVSAACDSQGRVLMESKAEYDRDHLSRTIDSKGNESTLRYDDAWRVLVSSQAVSDETIDGGSETRLTYDEWGNQVTGSVPGSTAYNLLRNGTFDLDPLSTGNGWDGPRAKSPGWDLSGQAYTGDHYLVLGDSTGPEYITSDEIAVDPSKTYTLSAWVNYWGQLRVSEYSETHVLLRDRTVLQSAAGTDADVLRRVSATYVPTAGTAFVRVQPYTSAEGGFGVDNIRFELANAASPDCFVENESMEQVISGLPKAWTRRDIAGGLGPLLGVYRAHVHLHRRLLPELEDPREGRRALHHRALDEDEGLHRRRLGVRRLLRPDRGLHGVRAEAAHRRDERVRHEGVVPLCERRDGARRCGEHGRHPVSRTRRRRRLLRRRERRPGLGHLEHRVRHGHALCRREVDRPHRHRAREHCGFPGPPDRHEHHTGRGSDCRAQCRDLRRSRPPRARRDRARLRPRDRRGLHLHASRPARHRHGTEECHDDSDLRRRRAPHRRHVPASDPLAPSLRRPRTPVRDALAVCLRRADRRREPGGLRRPRTRGHDRRLLRGRKPVRAHHADLRPRLAREGRRRLRRGHRHRRRDLRRPRPGEGDGRERSVGNDDVDRLLRGGLESAGHPRHHGARQHPQRHEHLGQDRPVAERHLRRTHVGLRVRHIRWPFERVLDRNVPADELHRRLRASRGRQARALRPWTRSGAGATSAAYAYDPSGNLTTATVGAATTAFSYDIGDRLTRSATGSAVTTHTNDVLGRRTSSITATGTTTYAWDPLSRLTAVTTPDTTATYSYGPTGARELKTVTTSTGTKSTRSVFAGAEIAIELDSDGTRYTYLWGPGRLPLSVTRVRSGQATETFAYQV